MTYFLEKTFELSYDFKIIPYTYNYQTIRPCQWSYRKCLAYWTGKLKNNKDPFTLLGACAIYDDREQFYCKSFEEWLIKLELEKGIVPDFEEHMLINKNFNRYESYIIKIIDLHTNEILEDNTQQIIDHLKTNHLI